MEGELAKVEVMLMTHSILKNKQRKKEARINELMRML